MYDNYRDYELEDFVFDEDFVNWVLASDRDQEIFWSGFLEAYPGKSELVANARNWVLGVHDHIIPEIPPNLETDRLEVWDHLRGRISRPAFTLWRNWIRVAASVAILAVVSFVVAHLYQRPHNKQITYENLIEEEHYSEPLLEFVNSGNAVATYILPDSSRVGLHPGGRISYKGDFQGDQRIVHLHGAAEFSVTPDQTKPFLVYSLELVTKVVGTRFFIDTSPGSDMISVTVLSGKVSVYPSKKVGDVVVGQDVLLTPNQSVAFLRESRRFRYSLIEHPKKLLMSNEMKTYTDAQVSTILDDLSKIYGIAIEYDAAALASCRLTTSLSAPELFDKLEIICESIGATYRVDGLMIIVDSPGCL